LGENLKIPLKIATKKRKIQKNLQGFAYRLDQTEILWGMIQLDELYRMASSRFPKDPLLGENLKIPLKIATKT
jgi:hypothetical protein